MDSVWAASAFAAGTAFGVLLLAMAIRLALRIVHRERQRTEDAPDG